VLWADDRRLRVSEYPSSLVRLKVEQAVTDFDWGNEQLSCQLIQALNTAKRPVFLIQAIGDYSLGPYLLLGRFLLGKGDSNMAHLYAIFGTTALEAHWDFATKSAGIAIWGQDVLTWLKKI
jgi:hypothetical protein